MKRRERNRKSAQKCRERKVQRTQDLQSQVECLQMEANRLIQELNGWRAQARQCVALLQHHCPGVAIPYLSCLSEQLPMGLPNFKEPLDGMVDNGLNYGQYDELNTDWKSLRENRKSSTYSNGSTTNSSALLVAGTESGVVLESELKNNHLYLQHQQQNFDTTVVLPSVNQLRSPVSQNRSKSHFGFLTTSDKDCSMLDAHLYSSTISTLNEDRQNGRPNIATSMLLSMTRSNSVVSMPGPASGSSSSSCSTYELSFPFSESHNRGAHEALGGLLKEQSDLCLMPVSNENSTNRSRIRIMSGQDSSSGNNPNKNNHNSSCTINNNNNNSNFKQTQSKQHDQQQQQFQSHHHQQQQQQLTLTPIKPNNSNTNHNLWEMDFHESDSKMECSTIGSPNSNFNCVTSISL